MPEPLGPAAKCHAQNVEHQRLAVVQAAQRIGAAALPHPGIRRRLRHHLEEGIAHLRKQMHVLVAVDEIGRAAEGVDEGAQLRGDLDRQQFRLQAARDRGAHHLRQRQKAAVAQRRKSPRSAA